MANSWLDGWNTTKKESRRFRGVEEKIGGGEYRHGDRFRWEIGRAAPEENIGETASGPVPRCIESPEPRLRISFIETRSLAYYMSVESHSVCSLSQCQI